MPHRALMVSILLFVLTCMGLSCSFDKHDSPERVVREHVAFELSVSERDAEATCSCGVVFHLADQCKCWGKAKGLSKPYFCECPIDRLVLPFTRPTPCTCIASPTLCPEVDSCWSGDAGAGTN